MTDVVKAIADRTALPWAATAGYAQTVTTTAPLVFTAGQGAFDAEGRLVAGDISEQTELAFANLAAVLASAGSGLGGIVSMTVYLARSDDFAAFKVVRARLLEEPYPALTTVRCDLLEPGMLIEVSAVAGVGVGRRGERDSDHARRPQ